MNEAGEEARNTPSPSSSRPYRSHRIPACDFCRRRKSRCTQDLANRPCLLCRLHGVECSRGGLQIQRHEAPRTATPRKKQTSRPQQRTQQDNNAARPASSQLAHTVDTTRLNSPHDQHANQSSVADTTSQENPRQGGHIVGPVVARDVQLLDQYMSPVYNLAMSHARPNPYSFYSDDPSNPIVYLKVPRHRGVVPSGNGSAAFKQVETVEKILDPNANDLFSLYFDTVHPAFPILDESTVIEAYRQNGLPHALVCEIYAASIISWNLSAKIAATGRPRPDVRYIWNLTVKALHEDFLAPSFSTVLASILDLTGRPTTSITYNSTNLGRTVALSQSLGLNHNPSTWNLDQRQKSLRIRTWWGILIHDRWASLTHGTPPHVNRTQYDVPLPDMESLLIRNITNPASIPSEDARIRGAQCFIALCQLTEILGGILPLIYDIQARHENNNIRAVRRYETNLDEWEDLLPSWLNPVGGQFDRGAPGALSLQLSFFAVKMCLSRIALQESAKSEDSEDSEVRQYYRSRCRKAAGAVVQFVVSLQHKDLDVFYLPYTAYHFSSATTLILRCALEAENDETARECVTSARTLIDHLRKAKDEEGWDLAEICLAQCETVVQQVCDGDYLGFRRRNTDSPRSARQDSIITQKTPDFQSTQEPKEPSTMSGNSGQQQLPQFDQPPSSQLAEGGVAAFNASAGGVPPEFNNMGMFHQSQGNIFMNPSFPDLWDMFQNTDGYGNF
ncbi:fungal specific transcription factor domain-containing protein [Phlyctema vagabunda]|uniref:Fungal specific transcription factor domain-containing protein n=1 Tax=Phlyctema vagabunda TaxID=108571 RepID=A0ABR4P5G5_9HELO